MSAGAFSITQYDSNETGLVHPIRVQPETLLAQIGTVVNDPPLVPPTNPISAQVSNSTRALGLHARMVTARLLGAPPAGYLARGVIKIPAMTLDFYNEAKKGSIMTYLSTSWTVIGRRAEVVR